MKFYDTNALLEDGSPTLPFAISSVTLQELENIKSSRMKSDDIKTSARRITHWLSDQHGNYDVIVLCDAIKDIARNYGLDISDPDVLICCSAKVWEDVNNEPVVFITHDLSCRNIAENILGLSVEWFDDKKEIYKGYKNIVGNTDFINESLSIIDFSDWYVNEYCIIHNTDDNSIKEMRYDGNTFVPLKLPSSKYIKGKNSLQRCALDMLNNPNITICAVLGGYGSGKTMLSTKCALMAVQEKGWQSRIIALREAISEGAEIGYLPGEKDSKILDFVLPFADQLDGGEFELESLKQRGILEANTPYFLKGRTFNSAILLVDEAEDMNEKQIRLIGTRVGENSRVIYNGDYKQSVIDSSKNNALIKMCNELKGNPKFGCIYLEADVRSETSQLFANLFQNQY